MAHEKGNKSIRTESLFVYVSCHEHHHERQQQQVYVQAPFIYIIKLPSRFVAQGHPLRARAWLPLALMAGAVRSASGEQTLRLPWWLVLRDGGTQASRRVGSSPPTRSRDGNRFAARRCSAVLPSARAVSRLLPGERGLNNWLPTLKTAPETPGASSTREKEKQEKKKSPNPAWNEFLSCSATGEVCLYSPGSNAEPAVRATLRERAKPCRDERTWSTGTASPGIYTWRNNNNKKKNLSRASHKELC